MSDIAIQITTPDGVQDTTVVDYDELDSFLNAVDYISKVDWSASPLPRPNPLDSVRTAK